MCGPFQFQFAAAVIFAAAGTLVHADPAVLTNAIQVLHITPARAAQALPVKLRGVVVDTSEPKERALIIADATASIYVSSPKNIFTRFHPRDTVEIEGVTSAGEFAPCVLATKVAVPKNAAVIPSARPTSYQELITGAMDAQFVEVKGVVREVIPAAKGTDNWKILLAANGGVLTVRIPPPQDTNIAVDAEVAVQAVCFYQFNNRRQAINPVLQIPHGRSATLLQPAPENPFASPTEPLESLLQFSSEIPFGHRVHVRGVVTLAQKDSQVWIRDASSSLRIQTRQEGTLNPGDEIDFLGFPAYGASSPVLEAAIFQKHGVRTPPVPIVITNQDDAFNHQNDLVSLEAKLTDIRPVVDGRLLTLERGTTSFKAVQKISEVPTQPPAWLPGSRVRIAGICDVAYDSARVAMGVWHPQSFQLLMRSADDLTVLRAPSWWTARHIIILLSCFLGALLVAGVVAAVAARRRLLEQARSRQLAEAEFAATLSERNRLAREMHDTLAQGFTATLLQLQLVKNFSTRDPDATAHHLNTAEKMIRSSLKEARNSIWQMHPQVLETGDLAGALKDVLQQLSDGVVAEAIFEVTGNQRRLAPAVESNLLRLGQEAITNSVKHSKATRLNVKLDFGESRFQLTIADNGRGFDPAHPPKSEGGFGITGMQERAKEIKGELKIRSAPDEGTEINLCVAA
jgi:signal transduction histidine kinase